MTVFEPIQFGKYQLLDKIAAGGMAELYRAKLTGAQGFEKLIAIKKILPHLCEEDNLVASFINEAKLAALLHHENIVQIYDFGRMDDEYFIAMEFIFGKDLRTIRKTAKERDLPLGMENILYIVSRICAGLDYSHNLRDLQGQPLNMIHRDINPQNVLVTYEGQLKIIDYGIAKAASQNTKTRDNLIKGKLAYMSPEQANGQIIDHRSDIFSTGIILYELLAVRRMFEGETMHVLSLVRDAQYDPPEEVIPDLPAKLNELLRRSLAKNPDDRYPSAGEMLADLEEFAFSESLRPNTRGFARYIKALFKDELAEEELALWGQSHIFEAGQSDRQDSQSRPGACHDHTARLTDATSNETPQEDKPPVFRSIRLHLEKARRLVKPKVAENRTAGHQSSRSRFRSAVLKPGLVLIVFLAMVAFGIKQISFSRHQPEDRSSPLKTVTVDAPAEIGNMAAGKAALAAKRYALAVTLFEEIIASDPAMVNDVAGFYVQACLGQATDLVEVDADQAEKILLKALKMDPDNISGLSNLGYIYMHRKNYPKAIKTYLKVTDLAPSLPDTFFNLGYVYAVTANYQQAKKMYRRVVALKPAFADEALFNLAVINDKLGERQECLKHLEEAVAINPNNQSAQKYLRQIKKKSGDKKG